MRAPGRAGGGVARRPLWVFRDGLDSRFSYIVFITLSGICVVGVVFAVGLTLRAF